MVDLESFFRYKYPVLFATSENKSPDNSINNGVQVVVNGSGFAKHSYPVRSFEIDLEEARFICVDVDPKADKEWLGRQELALDALKAAGAAVVVRTNGGFHAVFKITPGFPGERKGPTLWSEPFKAIREDVRRKVVEFSEELIFLQLNGSYNAKMAWPGTKNKVGAEVVLEHFDNSAPEIKVNWDAFVHVEVEDFSEWVEVPEGFTADLDRFRFFPGDHDAKFAAVMRFIEKCVKAEVPGKQAFKLLSSSKFYDVAKNGQDNFRHQEGFLKLFNGNLSKMARDKKNAATEMTAPHQQEEDGTSALDNNIANKGSQGNPGEESRLLPVRVIVGRLADSVLTEELKENSRILREEYLDNRFENQQVPPLKLKVFLEKAHGKADEARNEIREKMVKKYIFMVFKYFSSIYYVAKDGSGKEVDVYTIQGNRPLTDRTKKALMPALDLAFYNEKKEISILNYPLFDLWVSLVMRGDFPGKLYAVRSLAFQPKIVHDDKGLIWNTWKPKVAPEPIGPELSRLLELLKEVVPGERDREALLDWSANYVQSPTKSAMSALLAAGPEGSGKSTYGNVLREFAGNDSAKEATMTSAFSRFSSGFTKFFFMIDEVKDVNVHNLDAVEKMKSVIAGKDVRIERKGVTQSDADEHQLRLHCYMCTNETNLSFVGQGSRRFTVVLFPNGARGKGQNREESKVAVEFHKFLETEEGQRAKGQLLTFLMKREVPREIKEGDEVKTDGLDYMLATSREKSEGGFDKLVAQVETMAQESPDDKIPMKWLNTALKNAFGVNSAVLGVQELDRITGKFMALDKVIRKKDKVFKGAEINGKTMTFSELLEFLQNSN